MTFIGKEKKMNIEEKISLPLTLNVEYYSYCNDNNNDNNDVLIVKYQNDIDNNDEIDLFSTCLVSDNIFNNINSNKDYNSKWLCRLHSPDLKQHVVVWIQNISISNIDINLKDSSILIPPTIIRNLGLPHYKSSDDNITVLITAFNSNNNNNNSSNSNNNYYYYYLRAESHIVSSG